MNLEYTNSVSASGSDFRVTCGILKITDKPIYQNDIIIGIVRKGKVSVSQSDSYYEITKGCVYFSAPNTSYTMSQAIPSEIEYISINPLAPASVTDNFIPHNLLMGILSGSCTRFAVIPPEHKYYENVLSCAESILYAEKERPDFFQLLAFAKTYQLIYELFSNKILEIDIIGSTSKKYQVFLKITEYIDENYSKGISLEEVAEKTGVSRYYVSHLFKEILGTTFIGYVNDLRLNKAAKLLITTNLTIIEVAAQSGFNNLSNFNRAFKIKYNKTPSSYRRA